MNKETATIIDMLKKEANGHKYSTEEWFKARSDVLSDAHDAAASDAASDAAFIDASVYPTTHLTDGLRMVRMREILKELEEKLKLNEPPGIIAISFTPPAKTTVQFPPDTTLKTLIDFTNDCGIMMNNVDLIKKWKKYMPYYNEKKRN